MIFAIRLDVFWAQLVSELLYRNLEVHCRHQWLYISKALSGERKQPEERLTRRTETSQLPKLCLTFCLWRDLIHPKWTFGSGAPTYRVRAQLNFQTKSDIRGCHIVVSRDRRLPEVQQQAEEVAKEAAQCDDWKPSRVKGRCWRFF